MYWAVNSKASKEQQDAAKKFLNWLYTSDEGKDIVVNKFSFIGPLKAYSNMQPKDSLGQDVQKYVKSGKAEQWVFMGCPSGWGQDVFGKEVQKYLSGEESFDQVISNSQAQWEQIRK
jgi:raffinose/stachyose/melibiose transport system substrate-binding protein